MKKLNLVLVLTTIILFSCKKEEEKKQATCPATVAGIAGTYGFAAVSYKESPAAAAFDFMAMMDDCERKHTFQLKGDGTYIYTDACSTDEPTNGEWVVKDNVITIDEMLTGTISSYDCKQLTFVVSNSLQDGDRMTVTLKKQ